MYRIAVCDDDIFEINKTELLLDNYRSSHPELNFTINRFLSADKLMEKIAEQSSFDILLMDIYMSQKSGIEAAFQLRNMDFNGQIIFLTTSKEHALDAFKVNAAQYLVKPVGKDELFAALDKAFVLIEKNENKFLKLKVDNELKKVNLNSIVFCEAFGNYQQIKTIDGTLLRVRITGTKLFELMEGAFEFIRVGVSYIVNLKYVDSISQNDMSMVTGDKIRVPRDKYLSVKEQYFEFYCRR